MHIKKTRERNVTETPEEAAHYITTITFELAKIAARLNLGTLAYLLWMAELEASHIAGMSPEIARAYRLPQSN